MSRSPISALLKTKVSESLPPVRISLSLLPFKVSLPAPPLRISWPLPPSRTSLPFPPLRKSLTSPPSKISAPLPPLRISLPAPPVIVSLPCPPLRTSLPAPPVILGSKQKLNVRLRNYYCFVWKKIKIKFREIKLYWIHLIEDKVTRDRKLLWTVLVILSLSIIKINFKLHYTIAWD